jgi:hypothetical protein
MCLCTIEASSILALLFALPLALWLERQIFGSFSCRPPLAVKLSGPFYEAKSLFALWR